MDKLSTVKQSTHHMPELQRETESSVAPQKVPVKTSINDIKYLSIF
jgi:hypothetical protein